MSRAASPAATQGGELDRLVADAAAAGLAVHAGNRRWDVVLSRPERRNAQTPELWRLLERVGEAVARSRPDVVVLRSVGASFSAGLDRAVLSGAAGELGVRQLAALPDDGLDEALAGFQRAFTWWREVDAVTVAAVQGHAVGAGFQLALACDLRIVADDVQLSMREVALGLVPDLGGTAPLVQAVGYAVALHLCATGRPLGATEAVDRGLAVRAVPPGALGAATDELVGELLAAPPGAVAATKRLLRDAPDRTAQAQRAAERSEQAGRLRSIAEEVRRRGG